MRTKLFVWFICCACFVIPLSAQQEAETQKQETLIGGSVENGFFGGPLANIAFLNGKTTMIMGTWGAWLINHQLALGGGFYNLISPHTVATNVEMDVEYGVFTAEYIFSPHSIVHYTTQLSIGGGRLDFSRTGVGATLGNTTAEDVFFLVEPGINAEVNLLRFMRLQVGARYRIVSGVNNNSFGVRNTDISGLGVHCMVKFGKF